MNWNSKILTVFLSSLLSCIWPVISGVGTAERMASSWILSFTGGRSATQERIHRYLSIGVPGRERCVCVFCVSNCVLALSAPFLFSVWCFHSCRKFKKGSKKGSCGENGGQAPESLRLFWNHMGTSKTSCLWEVTTRGSYNISFKVSFLELHLIFYFNFLDS